MNRLKFHNDGTPRWVRLRLLPFEGAIATLVMIQGIVALTGIGGISNEIVPPWAGVVILSIYILSGAAILVGLAIPRGDLEAFGLILLGTSILARSVLLVAEIGPGSLAILSLSFAIIFSAACWARLRVLLPGGAERLLHANGESASKGA